MSVDLNKAGMLLHIASKARDWPNLRGLHDIVMAELEDMSKEAAQELADMRVEAKAKADAEANAQAAAAIEAIAKAKADEEAAAQKEIDDAKQVEQSKKALDDASAAQPSLLGGDATTTSDSARRL